MAVVSDRSPGWFSRPGGGGFAAPPHRGLKFAGRSGVRGQAAKIDPGHTFGEVKSYLKSQQQRIADGLAFVPPPIWMTLGERAQIESGQTGSWSQR